MSDIMELARRRAETRAYYEGLGRMNVAGLTIEEQIASAARYRLASDAYLAADREYRAAIDGLSAEKLAELATGEQ